MIQYRIKGRDRAVVLHSLASRPPTQASREQVCNPMFTLMLALALLMMITHMTIKHKVDYSFTTARLHHSRTQGMPTLLYCCVYMIACVLFTTYNKQDQHHHALMQEWDLSTG